MPGRRSPTAPPARRIPRSCARAALAALRRGGRFGSLVERFFEVIGRERCFVSVFDDLDADPDGQYRAMMRLRSGSSRSRAPTSRPRRESRGYPLRLAPAPAQAPAAFARDYLAGRSSASASVDLDEAVRATTRSPTRSSRCASGCCAGTGFRWPKRPIPWRVQARHPRAAGARNRPSLGALLGRDLSHWLEVREGRLG